MGLIGKPSSVLLTTSEMTPPQFQEFKEGWIRYEAIKLKRDGISDAVAKRTATEEFALHEKSGFQEINRVTLQNRSIRRSQV